MMKILLRKNVIAALFLVVFLAACNDSPVPVTPPPSTKKAAVSPVPVKDAIVDEDAAPDYVYNPTGTRDPFSNPLSALVDVGETGIPLTPLQRFDLNQLRLIGVIIGKGEPRAMVIAPDEKSFILRKGVKVGKNNGVVVGISTDSVSVREDYIDYTGDKQTRIEEIRLPKQGGAK